MAKYSNQRSNAINTKKLHRTMRFGCKGIQVSMHTFFVVCLAM